MAPEIITIINIITTMITLQRQVGLKKGNDWRVLRAAWHLVTVGVEQVTIRANHYYHSHHHGKYYHCDQDCLVWTLIYSSRNASFPVSKFSSSVILILHDMFVFDWIFFIFAS